MKKISLMERERFRSVLKKKGFSDIFESLDADVFPCLPRNSMQEGQKRLQSRRLLCLLIITHRKKGYFPGVALFSKTEPFKPLGLWHVIQNDNRRVLTHPEVYVVDVGAIPTNSKRELKGSFSLPDWTGRISFRNTCPLA